MKDDSARPTLTLFNKEAKDLIGVQVDRILRTSSVYQWIEYVLTELSEVIEQVLCTARTNIVTTAR